MGATLADAYRFRSRYATDRKERGRLPGRPARNGDNPVPLPGTLSVLLNHAGLAPLHVVRATSAEGEVPYRTFDFRSHSRDGIANGETWRK